MDLLQVVVDLCQDVLARLKRVVDFDFRCYTQNRRQHHSKELDQLKNFDLRWESNLEC